MKLEKFMSLTGFFSLNITAMREIETTYPEDEEASKLVGVIPSAATELTHKSSVF